MITKAKKLTRYWRLPFFCTPTIHFFYFLEGALIVKINSLIFKYPELKKKLLGRVPIDFILFFYFIAVCGTRSQCIFLADDCENKFIGPVLIVHPSYRLNVDHLLW